MFVGERLLVSVLTRRYVRAIQSEGPNAPYADLAADAMKRLSIDGVHRLRESLKRERERWRAEGENRWADHMTSAIRDLDSRAQILDDLLR
jgi:hypothetical protein